MKQTAAAATAPAAGPHAARPQAGSRESEGSACARRVWAEYGLAVLLFALISLTLQAQPLPDPVRGAAAFVWAISLLPLTCWRATRAPRAPMFELICASYGVQYSIPAIAHPNSVNTAVIGLQLTWEDTYQALLLVSLGLAAMIGAFYAVQRGLARHPLLRVDIPLSARQMRGYAALGLAMGTAASLAQLAGAGPLNTSVVAAVFKVIENQGDVGLVLLAYLAFTGAGGRASRLALFVATVVLFVLGLGTGYLENSLVPVGLVLIVYWVIRRRFPFRWLVPVLLSFVVLSAVKNDYRQAVTSVGATPSISTRLNTWLVLAQQRLELTLQRGPSGVPDLTQASVGRLDLVHIFSVVHELTPSQVPYYSGSTYSYLTYAWIPRFVWPGKPSADSSSGGVIYDYGILYRNNTATSVGLGQPAEAYANFGLLGVIFILALQGAFFAVLDSILNRQSSVGGRAVYLVITVAFLNGIGTGTAILFGAVVQDTLAGVLLLKGFQLWWRPHRRGRRARRGL